MASPEPSESQVEEVALELRRRHLLTMAEAVDLGRAFIDALVRGAERDAAPALAYVRDVSPTMSFTVEACPRCSGRGVEQYHRCLGACQVESVSGIDVLAWHPDRKMFTVSDETMFRIRTILEDGMTWGEHRRRLEEATAEARLQGRVDVGVRAIAGRL